ncbi:MAG TPA: hypothetical protein VFF16_10910, partial [Telluria sp.]|nr:hypothetical protein [Telluria sp.]
NYTDDMLMAYADGELDAVTRKGIENAMRADPALAARVEEHRALRALAGNAFADTLQEPVPERLALLVRPGSNVHSLDAARADRERRRSLRRWSWPELGTIAATLVVGVLAGHLLWQRESPLAVQDGAVVAQGALAAALSNQLAADPPGQVRIGLSFRARDGRYCRTFIMTGTAGLACREGEHWSVPVIAAAPDEAAVYRQAGSAMPAAVLDAVDQRIAGAALGQDAERGARDRAWRLDKRPPQ